MSPETIRLVVRGVVLFVALGVVQAVFGRFFSMRNRPVPTNKLPEWLRADPELAAGREKLILRMVRMRSWSDMASHEKFGHVFRFALAGAGLCLVAFLAFAFVFGITFPTMYDYLPEEALYARVFQSAFFCGLTVAIAGVGARLAWIEHQWKRLRNMSNKDLSAEYDSWMEYAAMANRVMVNLDQREMARYDTAQANRELARDIGTEMVKAGRQLEYERHTTIYPRL